MLFFERHPFVLRKNKNLRTSDKALLSAVLLGSDIGDDIESNCALYMAIDLCEECAEKGFGRVVEFMNKDYDGEEELERKLIAIL